MTISAKVIADSVSEQGVRLTTLQLRYPRFIHAEFMTHRVFSRNASSSRAVPVQRLIDDVLTDPAIPIYWGKNQPGMQAGKEHDDLVIIRKPRAMVTSDGGMEVEWWGDYLLKTEAWLVARDKAVEFAEAFAAAGYHKQIVNRILEPFAHINVIVTATDYDNFFELRDHEDAEPHIRDLARAMRKAMNESEPTLLRPGQWHLPYVDTQIRDDGEQSYEIRLTHPDDVVKGTTFVSLEKARKISTARCARVSYMTHDGRIPSIEEDLALAERLLEDAHLSPFEHQATPDTITILPDADYPVEVWCRRPLHGNLRGWIQNRKLLEG